MTHPLISKKMENLNTYYRHPSYYLERKLLQEIKSGLLSSATHTLVQINSLERAHLAPTPMRSVKNSLICSCTLFTRAAIEANVIAEDAFSLSDFMILEIEKIQEINQLRRYEDYMVKEFIHLVIEARQYDYSHVITKMIHHIHTHISDPLPLDDFCQLTGKSKGYLCSLFKKEVGLSITSYIQAQKIEEAKNFLLLTDLPILDIAELFGYCNATYFIKQFKSQYSTTPAAYRKLVEQGHFKKD